MPKFQASGIELPPDEFGIPAETPEHPVKARIGKGRSIGIDQGAEAPRLTIGLRQGDQGRRDAVRLIGRAGGPRDRAAGRRDDQARRSPSASPTSRRCSSETGSSLDRIAWVNWSLRDPSEFEAFNEEWVKSFPGEAPVGQGTLMPPQQRRAGFRISIGVIAEAS